MAQDAASRRLLGTGAGVRDGVVRKQERLVGLPAPLDAASSSASVCADASDGIWAPFVDCPSCPQAPLIANRWVQSFCNRYGFYVRSGQF